MYPNKKLGVWDKIMAWGRGFLFDPQKIAAITIFLTIAELLINILVIKHVKYTEIDWQTYMTHISLFKNGEYDYNKLTGPTGPCVYPAGYLYIYYALHLLTHGSNILMAQYSFLVFYIINFLLVLNIYRKSKKVPPYALMLLTFTSYRIHSIYVLRLFNDPIAILLLNLSINALIMRKYTIASAIISLALSIKMNILLYMPGFGVILVLAKGVGFAFLQGLFIILIQILIGLPFLLHNSSSYLSRAFQFDRKFEYKWTVNWRLLPEKTFFNSNFHLVLLGLHLTGLTAFALTKWTRCHQMLKVSLNFTSPIYRNLYQVLEYLDGSRNRSYDSYQGSMWMSLGILYILFTSNFLGIVFSRTLHYQFYVWYYYSLPFLLWSACGDPPVIRADNIKLLLWGLIEFSWNTFPSTIQSSLALNVCHWIILIGLFVMPQQYNDGPYSQKIEFDKTNVKKVVHSDHSKTSHVNVPPKSSNNHIHTSHRRKKFYN